MSAPVDLVSAPQCKHRFCVTLGILSGVPVEISWVMEEAHHEPVRLLLLHRKDTVVLARARADELLEQPAEFTEARVVGSVSVAQPAVPADAVCPSLALP